MREVDRELDRLPFHQANEPFLTRSFEEAAARLLFLSEQQWPAGWLVGAAGCGRTSLLRHVRRELRRAGIEAVLISLCGAGSDEFWPAVAAALGAGDGEHGIAARKTVRALLVASSMMNRPVTLLLDDVDRGGPGLMEQVAALVRMAEGVTPRHTIVVTTAGEIPVDDLSRRIDLRADLHPFTWDETAAYVFHRLSESNHAATFDDEAIDELFTATAGVPAAVVRLADLALVAADAAGETSVTSSLVRSANTELKPPCEDVLVPIATARPARHCA